MRRPSALAYFLLLFGAMVQISVHANTCDIVCTKGTYFSLESQSCADCPVGHYCLSGSTEAYPCPAGTFSSLVNRTLSTECLVCDSGAISGPGSASCSTCPSGTYADSTRTMCLACKAGFACVDGVQKACSTGLYSPGGLGQCLGCPAGMSCPDASTPPQLCDDGFYSTGNVTACTVCPAGKACPYKTSEKSCSPGEYALPQGCAICPVGYFCSDGIQKVVCPSNMYSIAPGSSSCQVVSAGSIKISNVTSPLFCPMGTLRSSTDDPGSCIVCPAGFECPTTTTKQACPSGSYSLGGQTNCFLCPSGYACSSKSASPTPCLPGTYSVNGSISCSSCPTGFTCPSYAATSPLQCTEGSYLVSNSLPCFQCPAGYSCSTDSATKLECPTGTYSSEGDGKCTACPSGYECPTPSQLYRCPLGTYSTGMQQKCTSCPSGYVCPDVSKSPVLCPPGMLSLKGDFVNCHPCPAGFYCPTEGSMFVCPAGYYSDIGAKSCTICPSGFACPSKLNGTMIACPRGSYSQKGSVECTNCPPGFYCDNKSATECPSGTFSFGLSSDCTACPGGYFCPKGSMRPIICPENTFSAEGSPKCSPCLAGVDCPAGSTPDIEADGLCMEGGYCDEGVGFMKCPSGTYNPKTNGTSISSCLVCPSGYYCPEGTTDPIRLQYICPRGFFCPNGTKTYLDFPCPVGTYVSEYGSHSSKECLPCDGGFYCEKASIQPRPRLCPPGMFCPTNGTSPTVPQSCPVGTHADGVVGLSSVDSCLECPAGYYCPKGSFRPQPCPAGFHLLDTGADSLAKCTKCPPGYYCREGTGEPFLRCQEGFYCPAGSTSGTPSQTSCVAGKYNPTIGASDSSSCLPCPAGFYCRSQTGSYLNPPVLCPAGFYCLAGTTDQGMRKCPQGTYSNRIGLQSESDCTPCPEGFYCGNNGGQTTITGICSAGYFCPEKSTSPTANPCPAGTYSTRTDLGRSDQCLACPPGFYCPTGTSSPRSCPMGTYSSGGAASSSTCATCPLGYFCPLEAGSPTPCPLGYYTLTSGSTSCSPCPQGTYCPNIATIPSQLSSQKCPAGVFCPQGTTFLPSLADSPCPAGYYCLQGTTEPTPCPTGTYNPSTGGTGPSSCITCPPGAYCIAGQSSITGLCPAGYFCPAGTQAADANPCLRGTFNPYTGVPSADGCSPCPPGSYCPRASVNPLPCPLGSYCPKSSGSPILCPLGTYSNTSSLRAESDCTDCPGGFYCDSPEITAPSGKCQKGYYCPPRSKSSKEKLCPLGNYCPAGSDSPNPCPTGTYGPQTSSGDESDCLKCVGGGYCWGTGLIEPTGLCLPGYYCPEGSKSPTEVITPPGYYSTEGSDSPTPCPIGTYAPVSGQAQCAPCPTGRYCGSLGVITPEPCPTGFYCPLGALIPTSCPAGTYNPTLGAGDANYCLDCPPSQSCQSSGLSKPSGLCSPGYFCKGRSSSSSPVGSGQQNGICPVGFYCPLGTSTPIPCPAGTFSTKTGLGSSGECSKCTAGQFCSSPGLTSPSGPCLAGYYCPPGQNTSSPLEFICPLGAYCPVASSTPKLCEAGYYSDQTGLAECKGCVAGFTCPSGAKTSTPCPKGYFCPSATSDPSPCPEGTFNPLVGLSRASECSSCLPGQYCGGTGLIEPQGDCLAGYFCAKGALSPTGKTAETGLDSPCPSGQYCPAGTLSPIPCPVGTFRSIPGGSDISSCFPCSAGSYCATQGLTKPTGNCTQGYFCSGGASTPIPTLQSQGSICPKGYYCPSGTKGPNQYPCPAGTYSNSLGLASASQCLACTPGHYCTESSLAPTGICAAGFYCEHSSPSATPSAGPSYGPCTKGFFCTEGTSEPQGCPGGKYCSESQILGDCDAGFYCVTGASSSQPTNNDPENGACPTGYYCPKGTVHPNPCPRGTFNPSPGMMSEDGCLPCTAGFYCSSTGLSEPQGPCAPGYYCPQRTLEQYPDGNECPTGHYCPEGSVVPSKCPVGSYQPSTRQSSCQSCVSGHFCPTEGASEPVICPSGSYCPSGSKSTTPCPAGTYSAQVGLTTDTECVQCPPGRYCPSGSSSEGLPCSAGYFCKLGSQTPTPTDGITGMVCPLGYLCPLGTPELVACPSGYYTLKTGGSAITDCSPCPPGKFCYFSVNGTVVSFVSGLCDAGFICTGGSNTPRPTEDTGYICPAGFECPSGALKESPCPSGTYAPNTGSEFCPPCPAGWFCPVTSTVQPTLCPIGSFCAEGSTQPTLCPAGTFGVKLGASDASLDCTPCPPGMFCPSPGQSSPAGLCTEGYVCKTQSTSPTPAATSQNINLGNGPCPSGAFCPSGSSSPQLCPLGTYQPKIGATSANDCLACDPGYYCQTAGLSSPTNSCSSGYYCPQNSLVTTPTPAQYICPAGSYCPAASSTPTLCSPGTYQPYSGAGLCQRCPAGSYCPEGSVETLICPVGHYCQESSGAPTKCPLGTYGDTRGFTSVSLCIACPAGHYCTDGTFKIANKCSAGYLCLPGSSTPTPSSLSNSTTLDSGPCPLGFYCPSGTPFPIPCPIPNTTLSLGAGSQHDCIPCPAGFTCDAGPANPCPAGFYCPQGLSAQPCPQGTYSPAKSLVSSKSCSTCPMGYYCPAGTSDYLPYPCPAGSYCPLGSAAPTPCPLGSFSSSVMQHDSNTCTQCISPAFCPEGSALPLTCPIGFYCPTGLDFAIPCPQGYYCPSGSKTPVECPSGYLCPLSVMQPLPKPANRICPNNSPNIPSGATSPLLTFQCPADKCCYASSTEPVVCPSNSFCPSRSAVPTICPLGYTAIDPPNGLRDSLASSCRPCPPGYAGIDPDRLKCEACKDGFVCLGASHSTTPDSQLQNGYPCPAGSYCPAASAIESLCPPGSYNPNQYSNSSSACLPCQANSYTFTPGQSGCFPCGHTSFSEQGASICTCYGLNRAFQPSDSSCRCKAGHQAYDASLKILESDGDSDCIPVEYPTCGINQLRTADGTCIDDGDQYCAETCLSGAGKFLLETGICECDGVKDVDEICNYACRQNQNTVIYNPTQKGVIQIVAPDGTVVSTINLADSSSAYSGTISCGSERCSLSVVSMQGISGGFLGVLDPSSEYLESLFVPATQSSNSSRSTHGYPKNKRTTYPAKGISNPIMCVKQDQSVLFHLLPETGHYPVYDKNNILNSNPAFDYTPFVALEDEILNQKSMLTTFAFAFPQPGTYVFRDSIDETQQSIIKVIKPSENCGDSKIQPKSLSSMSKYSLSKTPPSNTGPNWGIFASIMTAFGFVSIAAIIAHYHHQNKVKLPRDPVFHPIIGKESDPDLVWTSQSKAMEDSLPFDGDDTLGLLNIRSFYDILENQNLLLRQKLNDSFIDSKQQFEKMSKKVQEMKAALETKVGELSTKGIDAYLEDLERTQIDDMQREVKRRQDLANKALDFLAHQKEAFETESIAVDEYVQTCSQLEDEILNCIDELQKYLSIDIESHSISGYTQELNEKLQAACTALTSKFSDEANRRGTWIELSSPFGGILVDPLTGLDVDMGTIFDGSRNLREIPNLVKRDQTTRLFVPCVGTLLRTYDGRQLPMPPGMCLHPVSGCVIPIQGNVGIDSESGAVVFTFGYSPSNVVRLYPYLASAIDEDTGRLIETPWKIYATRNNIKPFYTDPFTGQTVPTLAVAIDPLTLERIPIGACHQHPIYKILRPVHLDDFYVDKASGYVFSVAGVHLDTVTGKAVPIGGFVPDGSKTIIIRGKKYYEGLSGKEVTISGCAMDISGNLIMTPTYGDELTYFDCHEMNTTRDISQILNDIITSISNCFEGVMSRDDAMATAHFVALSSRIIDFLKERVGLVRQIRQKRKMHFERRAKSQSIILEQTHKIYIDGGLLGKLTLRSGQKIPLLLGEPIKDVRSGMMCPVLGVHLDKKTSKIIPLAGTMNDPITGDIVPILVGGRMRNPKNGNICFITGAKYDEVHGKVVPVSEMMKTARSRVVLISNELLHRANCVRISGRLYPQLLGCFNQFMDILKKSGLLDYKTIEQLMYIGERAQAMSKQIHSTWKSSDAIDSRTLESLESDEKWNAVQAEWNKRIENEASTMSLIQEHLDNMRNTAKQLKDLQSNYASERGSCLDKSEESLFRIDSKYQQNAMALANVLLEKHAFEIERLTPLVNDLEPHHFAILDSIAQYQTSSSNEPHQAREQDTSGQVPKELRTVLDLIQNAVDEKLRTIEGTYQSVERPKQKIIRKVKKEVIKQPLVMGHLPGQDSIKVEEDSASKKSKETPPKVSHSGDESGGSSRRRSEDKGSTKGMTTFGAIPEDDSLLVGHQPSISSQQSTTSASSTAGSSLTDSKKRIGDSLRKASTPGAAGSLSSEISDLSALIKGGENKDANNHDDAEAADSKMADIEEERKEREALLKRLYEEKLEQAKKSMTDSVIAQMKSIEEDFQKCRDLIEAQGQEVESFVRQMKTEKSQEVSKIRNEVKEQKNEARSKIGSRLLQAANKVQGNESSGSLMDNLRKKGIFVQQKKGGQLAPIQFYQYDADAVNKKMDTMRKNLLSQLNHDLQAEAEQEMQAVRRKLHDNKKKRIQMLKESEQLPKLLVDAVGNKAAIGLPSDSNESTIQDLGDAETMRKVEEEIQKEIERHEKLLNERMNEKRRRKELEIMNQVEMEAGLAPTTEEDLQRKKLIEVENMREQTAIDELADLEMMQAQQIESRRKLLVEEKNKIIEELKIASNRENLLVEEREKIDELVRKLEEENAATLAMLAQKSKELEGANQILESDITDEDEQERKLIRNKERKERKEKKSKHSKDQAPRKPTQTAKTDGNQPVQNTQTFERTGDESAHRTSAHLQDDHVTLAQSEATREEAAKHHLERGDDDPQDTDNHSVSLRPNEKVAGEMDASLKPKKIVKKVEKRVVKRIVKKIVKVSKPSQEEGESLRPMNSLETTEQTASPQVDLKAQDDESNGPTATESTNAVSNAHQRTDRKQKSLKKKKSPKTKSKESTSENQNPRSSPVLGGDAQEGEPASAAQKESPVRDSNESSVAAEKNDALQSSRNDTDETTTTDTLPRNTADSVKDDPTKLPRYDSTQNQSEENEDDGDDDGEEEEEDGNEEEDGGDNEFETASQKPPAKSMDSQAIGESAPQEVEEVEEVEEIEEVEVEVEVEVEEEVEVEVEVDDEEADAGKEEDDADAIAAADAEVKHVGQVVDSQSKNRAPLKPSNAKKITLKASSAQREPGKTVQSSVTFKDDDDDDNDDNANATDEADQADSDEVESSAESSESYDVDRDAPHYGSPVDHRATPDAGSINIEQLVSNRLLNFEKMIDDLQIEEQREFVERMKSRDKEKLEKLEKQIRDVKLENIRIQEEMERINSDIDNEGEEEVARMKKEHTEKVEEEKKRRKKEMLIEFSRSDRITEADKQAILQQYELDVQRMEKQSLEDQRRNEEKIRAKLEAKKKRQIELAQKNVSEQLKEAEELKKEYKEMIAEQSKEVISALVKGHHDIIEPIQTAPDSEIVKQQIEAQKELEMQQEREKMELQKQLEEEERQMKLELEKMLGEKDETWKQKKKAIRSRQIGARVDEDSNTLIDESMEAAKSLQQSAMGEKDRQTQLMLDKLAEKKRKKLQLQDSKHKADSLKLAAQNHKERIQLEEEAARAHEERHLANIISSVDSEKASDVVELVLQTRHGKELEDFSQQQELERKAALAELENALEKEHSEQLIHMISAHEKELRDCILQSSSNPMFPEIQTQLLNRQQEQVKEMEAFMQSTSEQKKSELARMIDRNQARERLAFRESQLRELVRVLEQYAPESEQISPTLMMADELRQIQKKFENDQEEQKRKLLEARQRYEEEERNRLEQELQDLESREQMMGEKDRGKLSEDFARKKAELLQKQRELAQRKLGELNDMRDKYQDNIIQRHEGELKALEVSIANDRDRQDVLLKMKLEQKKEGKLKKKRDEELKTMLEKEQMKMDQIAAEEVRVLTEINAKQEQMLVEKHQQIVESLKEKSPEVASALKKEEQRRIEKKMEKMKFTAQQLEKSPLGPLYQKVEEIDNLFNKWKEYMTRVSKAKPTEPLFYHDPTDVMFVPAGEVVPVLPDNLKAREFIVYQYSLSITSMLSARFSIPRVDLLVTGNIPKNNYSKNAFRNSVYFDAGSRMLFIRRERFSDPGDLMLVLVHSMAHISVNDMSDDSNPDFVQAFSSFVQACFFNWFNSRNEMKLESESQAQTTPSVIQSVLDKPRALGTKANEYQSLISTRAVSGSAIYDREYQVNKILKNVGRDMDTALPQNLVKYLEDLEVRVAEGKTNEDEARKRIEELEAVEKEKQKKQRESSQSDEGADKYVKFLQTQLAQLTEKNDDLNTKYVSLNREKAQIHETLKKRAEEMKGLTQRVKSASDPNSAEVRADKVKLAELAAFVRKLSSRREEIIAELEPISVTLAQYSEQMRNHQARLDAANTANKA